MDPRVVLRADDEEDAADGVADSMYAGVVYVGGRTGELGADAVEEAFTEDDQKRLCTGDVFRLCSSEIPDRERIIACMRHKRAQLSQGCRSVFGKPAQSASAKESGWGWR